MIKVSVIMPVYNVEKYLTKCLDSVCNQTLEDIEIICVNDCSPDNSLAILKTYAQKDNRIKIVNRKKNGGLSAARNSGLAIAQGKYIYFIDSDDWIDLDYLEKMYNAAIESNENIIVNTSIVKDKDGKKSEGLFSHYINKNTNKQFINAKENIHKLAWSAWTALWKKDFLDTNKLKFPEGYNREDEYFQAVAYSFVNKVYVIKESKYYYRLRADSICGDWQKNLMEKYKSYIDITLLTIEWYKKNNTLNNIAFKIFVEEFFDCTFSCETIAYTKELQQFIKKVYPIIEKNKEDYLKTELEFIEDILQNTLKLNEPSYYKKKIIFDKLRKNRENAKNICNNTSI